MRTVRVLVVWGVLAAVSAFTVAAVGVGGTAPDDGGQVVAGKTLVGKTPVAKTTDGKTNWSWDD
ncbi:MAG TPA: hypothetical protein VES95_07900 [Dermatophilaceae bacterium]|nr:hypothetical protein [Dermatophilaceae bacterium]